MFIQNSPKFVAPFSVSNINSTNINKKIRLKINFNILLQIKDFLINLTFIYLMSIVLFILILKITYLTIIFLLRLFILNIQRMFDLKQL